MSRSKGGNKSEQTTGTMSGGGKTGAERRIGRQWQSRGGTDNRWRMRGGEWVKKRGLKGE